MHMTSPIQQSQRKLTRIRTPPGLQSPIETVSIVNVGYLTIINLLISVQFELTLYPVYSTHNYNNICTVYISYMYMHSTKKFT